MFNSEPKFINWADHLQKVWKRNFYVSHPREFINLEKGEILLPTEFIRRCSNNKNNLFLGYTTDEKEVNQIQEKLGSLMNLYPSTLKNISLQ